MKDFFSKFKIPTILGLAIIFLGIASGVYLVLKDQIYFLQAAPNVSAQNVTFSNITDTSAVVSWETASAVLSFITFGQNNPAEQTVLNDRDQTPQPHRIHYVTLKNLTAKTTYQLKITTGKTQSEIFKFETSSPASDQSGFNPVIGSVTDHNNTPLNEGIAYLSITGAITQSALIKGGNFLISISNVKKQDLTDYLLKEDVTAKITIVSDNGTANMLVTLKKNSVPLPSVKLGQNIDLTTLPEETPQPSTKELNEYDLNSDGKINAADNAIILQNFGRNPKEKRADLDKNGKVDQDDLDLMAVKIKELGPQ
ncbi:hypothetical protein HYS95_01340 [Candidatus Daviesbacteria bacterium]|nr:hypothetical protein [Candidatus Daviesbacteria bacterium]